MALKLKQPGVQPLGQFDGLDTIVTSVLGGEVGTITGIDLDAGDLAAADADDGYANNGGGAPGVRQRPVITTALSSGDRPLGLIDDGNSPHYGTLFGSVLGATAGQDSHGPLTTGTVLGPHTATGSGKLTFWTKPGTYAVTLDAADTSDTGLVPTNALLSIGDPLFATSAGLLTPTVGSAFENVVLARFLNFETNGSLVTTPVSLVSAANSPVGVGQPQDQEFSEAVFEFAAPIA